MRVLMRPHLSEIGNAVSGIHTVIRKYFIHLKEFDVDLVDVDATSYDVTAAHAGITGGDTMVCHAHGLYWSGDIPCDEWEWHVNSRVIEAIRNAKEITVPSAWVNETFKRELRKPAHVIPHGVDWQEWQHKEPSQGYVLWNKNRNNSDVVSNSILDILIPRFRDVTFVSTFTTPNLSKLPHNMWPDNFKIIETGGKTPHEQMKGYTQGAGVYLSTAKETWGIGIVEAMASGVPILGWDWGGNSFLVRHGCNGFLATLGDIDQLCEGLNYCINHRKILGANGREMAKQWTWEKACEMVAGVYRLAMTEDIRPMTIDRSLYEYQNDVDNKQAKLLKV